MRHPSFPAAWPNDDSSNMVHGRQVDLLGDHFNAVHGMKDFRKVICCPYLIGTPRRRLAMHPSPKSLVTSFSAQGPPGPSKVNFVLSHPKVVANYPLLFRFGGLVRQDRPPNVFCTFQEPFSRPPDCDNLDMCFSWNILHDFKSPVIWKSVAMGCASCGSGTAMLCLEDIG